MRLDLLPSFGEIGRGGLMKREKSGGEHWFSLLSRGPGLLPEAPAGFGRLERPDLAASAQCAPVLPYSVQLEGTIRGSSGRPQGRLTTGEHLATEH
jgi:hypothetical protein